MSILFRLVFFGLLVFGSLSILFFANANPGYFSNMTYLGAILLAEILVASTWQYERTFFLLLMLAFLAAGTNTPLLTAGMSARWFVLAVGASAGYVKWMKGPRQHFGAFHLVALFCVLAALVSAMVSAMPQMALLKVLSLFLLFLYGSSGARLAVLGREARFMNGLVLGSELTVYISFACYFILHEPIFGNPNSLGVVMGVVAAPMLLWGALVAETRPLRHRRIFSLFICGFLLYFSLSRAAMAAAAASTILLCISLKRQKLLLHAMFTLVLLLAAAGVVAPAHFDDFVSTVTSGVMYKGKQQQGVLGSRRTPWQQTVDVIQQHPWFGSGFGTSELAPGASNVDLSLVYTKEETGREHGSSYLAIVEWVGLVGILPFIFLLFFVLQAITRVCGWMRQTASPQHYSIPLAMILSAALVHAIFEDWLFAAGYYLTVFFWSLAFVVVDLAPRPQTQLAGSAWHPAVLAAPGVTTLLR